MDDQLELFDTFAPKLEAAIGRVCEAWNFTTHLGMGKLYVCFSGGKDSVALYGVCRLAAEKLGIDLFDMCEFVYAVTGIDPPELVRFIRKEFPFVRFDYNKETMWSLIPKKQMPPTRLVRYCCSELKENHGNGRFCLTGVRWAESVARRNRGEFESVGNTKKDKKIYHLDNDADRRELEHCIPKHRYVCNPIVDWGGGMMSGISSVSKDYRIAVFTIRDGKGWAVSDARWRERQNDLGSLGFIQHSRMPI